MDSREALRGGGGALLPDVWRVEAGSHRLSVSEKPTSHTSCRAEDIEHDCERVLRWDA